MAGQKACITDTSKPMDSQLLILVCAVASVSMLGFFATKMLVGRGGDEKLRDRLSGKSAKVADSFAPPAAKKLDLKGMFQQLGQAAAKPFMPKTREAQSGLREQLGKAGIYSPNALKVMVGAKVIFLVVGVIGGYGMGLATDKLFLGLPVGGLVGYILPMIWLKTRIKANQRGLTYGLADALDLMVVCVEAGLTVDAAMQRVGQELGLAHPGLAREFGIAHMETRVGLARSEALRNLGIRTGCPALQSLASMLVQADRFGTSIAQALRVHSETLRQNRQFAAEEMAAKASVKISFPLVLFIFPSTFIVLCGPTILDLMDSPLFK
jgi:tight adherence protein C